MHRRLTQRNIILAIALAMLLGTAVTVGIPQVGAQAGGAGQIISGLLNVSLVNVNANIGPITATDVIDISNVLNNNDVRILNDALNNNRVLNNSFIGLNLLLQDLDVNDVIANNVVVVGVNLLTGQIFVLPVTLVPWPL
jgi:hypothetical protein